MIAPPDFRPPRSLPARRYGKHQRPHQADRDGEERLGRWGRHNAYTFEVHPDANKYQVHKAVEEIFKVNVADVRTMVRKGKRRRTRYGVITKSDKKRAVVVLKGEDRIELF